MNKHIKTLIKAKQLADGILDINEAVWETSKFNFTESYHLADQTSHLMDTCSEILKRVIEMYNRSEQSPNL